MGLILFLLFVGLPIAEIAVFIQAGDIIGLWPTLGLVILTAAAGAALARSEGRSAMRRLAAAVEAGDTPTGPLIDAVAIFLGGVLLLTPGFITDCFGLSLLFVPTRGLWGRAIVAFQAMRSGRRPPSAGPGPRPGPCGTTIIDGEYEERPDPPQPPDRRIDP